MLNLFINDIEAKSGMDENADKHRKVVLGCRVD
jgi:hypothetical protein